MTTVAINVTRHQCPYCRRAWSNKKAAERHVARCWYNPAVRACKTCSHFWPANGEETEDCDEDGMSIKDGLKTGCKKWELREDGA
jgi:hypothetical protein